MDYEYTFCYVSGKVHEWDDIPMDQRPDYSQVAVHAAPNLNIPDVADPVAESLNAGIGKGEKSFNRPHTFVSAYRRVFDQHRGVFGTQAKTPAESPKLAPKLNHNNKNISSDSESKFNWTNVKSNWSKDIDNSSQNVSSKKSNPLVCPNDGLQLVESPKAPTRKQTHFLDNETNKSSKLDNEPNKSSQLLDNNKTVALKRQQNMKENKAECLFSRQPGQENIPNLNAIKPADALRTPYLLPMVSPNAQQSVGNFPQINSTSMVAKTKALFEEKDKNDNFVPLGKSRTFSSFPTGNDNEVIGTACPLTPSVPQRKSSKKVFATYKSMNANMDNCGMESRTNSPFPERRIPMRNFFW